MINHLDRRTLSEMIKSKDGWVARLKWSCVICSKLDLELWGLALSIWSTVRDTSFARHLLWKVAASGLKTSWLKYVPLNGWSGGNQLIRTIHLMPQNSVDMGFSEFESSWDRFSSPNPYWTWAYIQEDPTFIFYNKIAETNVWLCFQDLEKRFCAVGSFPPKLLREHVWDSFEMTTLKTKRFGHVLPDCDSWNV
jgi:hypothetical protein